MAGDATPRASGFRMPAEWEPHEATWLAWPHNEDTWPHEIERVQQTWVKLIRALGAGERVHLLVNDTVSENSAAVCLDSGGVDTREIIFHRIPTVDVWIRDYGPTFITAAGGSEALLDWRFNAWGKKYQALKEDERIPKQIESILGIRRFEAPLVLEGGAIDVNGVGLCLATEECLLNPNRNNHHSKSKIEQCLKDFLGIQKMIWLSGGIKGDDTDGHVDQVARFVNPRTIVCALEKHPASKNYQLLQDNYKRLKLARDTKEHLMQIICLPVPEQLTSSKTYIPASYINFYIANRIVLVPTFNQVTDNQALSILQQLFSDREVKGLDCRSLARGLGTIHCVTQQQPRLYTKLS